MHFFALSSFIPSHHGVTMSRSMKAIALGQDKIGWLHFLERKITGHFKCLQQIHLRSTHCRINADNWCKQFTVVYTITRSPEIWERLLMCDRIVWRACHVELSPYFALVNSSSPMSERDFYCVNKMTVCSEWHNLWACYCVNYGITRLIKISHTQWVFRNLTLHDVQFGHLI